MYVFYEDDGGFKAGSILSETDASLQVEAASGKRSKVKKQSVMFRFAQPAPEALMRDAEAAAGDIDLEFLWECAPKDEFDVPQLAEEYFGHPPSPLEQATLLLRVHGAPVYFHRRGKGRYRPAPADILAAALAAVEKKKRQAEQLETWVAEIAEGKLPDALRSHVDMLLCKPDKNTQEWKALEAASQRLRKQPPRLLLELGAFPHALAIHKRRFLSEEFPRGTAFAPVTLPTIERELPLSDAEPYSIDDVTTTEIDDALSVKVLDDGRIRVGIHIAAPGLVVTRDSEFDKLARARMSTVYMPGDKIPMQPDEVIAAFSLDAGKEVPAVSLYITADPATGEIFERDTRIERVVVKENLRHNLLDEAVTEAALDDPAAELPHAALLRPLWQFAQALSNKRAEVRGKPELNNRVEFSFYVDGNPDDPDAATVRIVQRKRNAPLDRMVAEYMILANSEWGALLSESGVPGIYRTQQAGRVRMSTAAGPHEAMGVAQYAWHTSPLRRYVDLINQWQLIAAADHGVSARLVAPFKPRDADLFAIIGAFESKYSAYNDFQQAMERYWCLRWLKQEGIARPEAVVLRDDLVRLKDAPFVFRAGGLPQLERGQHVLLEIIAIDELDLGLEARFIDVVQTMDAGIEDEAALMELSQTDEGTGDGIEPVEPTPAEGSEQIEAAEVDAADGPDLGDQPLPTEEKKEGAA